MAPFLLLLVVLLPMLCAAFNFRSFRVTSVQISPSMRTQTRLTMSFGGISEKLGSLVEYVSGQQKISEANIEDTLKVQHALDFNVQSFSYLKMHKLICITICLNRKLKRFLSTPMSICK